MQVNGYAERGVTQVKTGFFLIMGCCCMPERHRSSDLLFGNFRFHVDIHE
jgi:hypothetical protein